MSLNGCLGSTERGSWGGVGRKGWQRVGERMAKGWRKVGTGLAKGWHRVGLSGLKNANAKRRVF